MNILPGDMRFGAGQPVRRLEDQRLLTGKGQFIDDRPEDGALWLHVLRSPHAHAKIVSIDIKAAREMPGVEAVYTGADLVADDIGTIPTLSVFMRPDGSPMTVPPRRLLAHEIVRFAGEPVAAVAATSRVAAQTAAEAIAVEYEVLPSVVDPIAATKPGAPVVWTNAPDNIVAAMSYGDAAAVEAAFAKAAHVVSLDLVSQRLIPSAMEPRSTIAEVDKKSGRLILHVQSQTPGSTRDVLAEAVLKRPKESVRVLVGDIGGGFGQKTNLYPEDGMVAYAAVKLARKVRWRGDRTDEFVGGTHGRGLTSYIEWTGGRAHTEKVSLHATAEGRVILHSGTQAMGQGLQTTYSQMIAESLGIPMDKIDVVQGDTDLATGFGSVGSRSLFVGGTAVAVSSNDLIAKAREKASNMLEASVEDIEYRDGWLTVVGTDKRVGLFDIAKKETGARLSVDSEGEVDGPSWPNGTHICEVEIDPETGVSRVVRYTTVDDVGVAVNPMLVTGQVHGGVAQGIGQALYEGVAYDPEGQLLTASYQDYCLPRADDIPPIEVTLDDSAPCRTNPLGAKGCGESGAIGGPPCITNGVMDALSELGIKTLNTPLSPLKVWQAIREAKAARV